MTLVPPIEGNKYISLTCPFCNDDDFDAIGLKIHLIRGWCDAFEKVPTIDPLIENVSNE
jgi:hypothetical protein